MTLIPHLTEFDYYIAPDGTEYLLSDLDIRAIMSSSGHGMAEIAYQSQQGPFQHGITLLDYRLQPRIIQILHRRKAGSRQFMWDARANVIDILRPNRQTVAGALALGTYRKILPDGTRRDLDVLLQAGPAFTFPGTVWDEWSVNETLRFIAPDPTYYDPGGSESIFGFVELTELVFPITFPIVFGGSRIDATNNVTYLGTWLAYPTIVITGPFNAVTITNETTGESITLNYNIPIGETVTFDLRYGYKTVTNNFGTNLIGSLSPDSDLATFHLEPAPSAVGGVNVIRVEGSGAGLGSGVTVSWNSRYIGI